MALGLSGPSPRDLAFESISLEWYAQLLIQYSPNQWSDAAIMCAETRSCVGLCVSGSPVVVVVVVRAEDVCQLSRCSLSLSLVLLLFGAVLLPLTVCECVLNVRHEHRHTPDNWTESVYVTNTETTTTTTITPPTMIRNHELRNGDDFQYLHPN